DQVPLEFAIRIEFGLDAIDGPCRDSKVAEPVHQRFHLRTDRLAHAEPTCRRRHVLSPIAEIAVPIDIVNETESNHVYWLLKVAKDRGNTNRMGYERLAVGLIVPRIDQ